MLHSHKSTIASKHIIVCIDYDGEDYPIKATGFYGLSTPCEGVQEFSLEDFNLEDLSHLPEELRERLEAGEFEHVFYNRLQEAEML